MPLLDSFLLEVAKTNVWIALRSDDIRGDGSAGNPYNGGLSYGPAFRISLIVQPFSAEAMAETGGAAHGFSEGDMVQISGVTGPAAEQWNRVFGVYDVTLTSFKFARGIAFLPPEGSPTAALVRFLFDKILRDLPPYTRVNISPSPRDALDKPIPFQTRGFAPQGVGGWQPKSGQKIVGSGIDSTVLQLVDTMQPTRSFSPSAIR